MEIWGCRYASAMVGCASTKWGYRYVCYVSGSVGVGVVGEGVVGACATNDVIVLPNQVVVVDREVDRLPGVRCEPRGTRWECIGEGLK